MANDEVLRLRATVLSDEAMANIRMLGREVERIAKMTGQSNKENAKGFESLAMSIKKVGNELLAAAPALTSFGFGAAGIGIAYGTVIRTMGDLSKRVVELKYASKELGMTERDLRAWQATAAKVGIAPEAMMSGLKGFKKTTDEFKYNIGGVRDQLIGMGAGPVVAAIMNARSETDKLSIAFRFKEQLEKDDPSGFKARMFFEMIGLGADAARLSMEQYNKEHAKTRERTQEEQARFDEFHTKMVDLGTAWEDLTVKAGVLLLPGLIKDIENVEKLIGYFDTLKTAYDKYLAVDESHAKTVVDLPGFQMGIIPGSPIDKLIKTLTPGPQTFGEQPAHRAGGGSVMAGRRYLVGERGPEIMTPGTGGMISPNGFGATGDHTEGVRMVREGVYAALIDFQNYVQAGGGGSGFTNASFGDSATSRTGSTGGGGGAGNRGGSRHALGRRLGMDRGDDGGPGKPGNTPPPSGNLAAQRAGFMKELEADPHLKAYAIDAMQHEGGIQSNMEQLFNYAAMRKMTVRQALHSGQYGPVNRGMISGNISAKTAAQGEAALKAVGAGSNITDYATDQGMAGDPNYAKYQSNPAYWGMHKVQGAWFSAHGEQGRRWAERQKSEDAKSKLTAERIDGATVLPMTNVKGHVNVTVNSNGTAAKTKADSDGFWQRSTITNYKQMQATDKPPIFPSVGQ